MIGNALGEVPPAEPRPIFLRAYAEPITPRPVKAKRGGGQRPSNYVLVFDCETTADVEQKLRFGTYQVRLHGVLREKGLFYDPDAVNDQELEALYFHRPPDQKLRTLQSFLHEVFYAVGYAADATIVGFNLPFDISRLAIRAHTARTFRRGDKVDRSMVGGFTFTLVEGKPNVRVKHLSRRAAFINFAAADETPNGERVKRGFFLDLKTLAAALTTKSFTLDRLAEHLGQPKKKPFTDFRRQIDAEFIAYAVQDAETTWRCYEALLDLYARHPLWPTRAGQIYSEASLGKAYLRAMKIKPWREVQTDVSAQSVGRIMSAYYGGRAEVHRRREVIQTRYCDFASMYPTVCSRMDLWPFVIATGYDEADATVDARRILATVTLDTLRAPEFWKELRVLVEVKPDQDIFPVRSRYGEGPSHTIGVNYLSADRTLWFTLADCIASTLLAGKPPEVIRAIRYSPRPPQTGLRPVAVAGGAHLVNPATEDFYRRVINIRRGVKRDFDIAEAKGVPKVELDRLDFEQLGLKILANATSYGIFIELNPEPTDDGGAAVAVHGASEQFTAQTAKIEQPGGAFNPLLAVLITGAARLMLALTERLAREQDLDWVFCDTDSMAFAKPVEMQDSEFYRRVDEICRWFDPLNPYEGGGSILEVEKQNRAAVKNAAGRRPDQPLFCFAISAKRYALFNVGPGEEVVIRKASAHGLGHLMPPYRHEAADGLADEPADDEPDTGVAPWQEDAWKAIIRSAIAGHPRRVNWGTLPGFDQIAAGQHTASTPDLLKSMAKHNQGLEHYADRIKPFNFMLWYHAKRPEDRLLEADSGAAPVWRPRERHPKAVSPYYKHLADVPDHQIVDRDTGEIVPRSALRTYAEVLRNYHRSAETKFLNGGGHDTGPLRRRHVVVDQVFYIGKEADGFEERDAVGDGEDDVQVYSPMPEQRAEMIRRISAVPVAKLKRKARVGHDMIARVLAGDPTVPDRIMLKLNRAAFAVERELMGKAEEQAELHRWATAYAGDRSIAELARLTGDDASNLAKAISSGKIGPKLAKRLTLIKETLGDNFEGDQKP